METNMGKYKTYTPEFKHEAITLAKTQGVTKTATNLGINPNIIHRWKNEQETRTTNTKPVFTGRGNQSLSVAELEIQKLRRELEITRQERDILKKAVTCLDLTAAPSGLVASLPKKPVKICVHPQASH
jgi:transposase